MRTIPAVEAERLGERDIHRLLSETAQQVKVMKASWLRVALNLQKIRNLELWRHVQPSCENFEDYAFGVLKLQRAVVRRMLQAMDYTTERRPEFVEEFQRRGDEMEVPSYDTVNHLRRAESAFEDRRDDFRNLESRVFDEGVGRVTLKKEIDTLLGGDDEETDDEPSGTRGTRAATEHDQPERPLTVADVVARLKPLERRLLELKVSKEARQLMFRLVEALEKEK